MGTIENYNEKTLALFCGPAIILYMDSSLINGSTSQEIAMSAIVIETHSRPDNKGVKRWAVASATHVESGYSVTRYNDGTTCFFNSDYVGGYAMLTRQNGKIYDALKAAV